MSDADRTHADNAHYAGVATGDTPESLQGKTGPDGNKFQVVICGGGIGGLMLGAILNKLKISFVILGQYPILPRELSALIDECFHILLRTNAKLCSWRCWYFNSSKCASDSRPARTDARGQKACPNPGMQYNLQGQWSRKA